MAIKNYDEEIGAPVVSYYDPSGPAAGDMFWSMATSRTGCYIADGADYLGTSEPELYAALGTAFNTQINPTTGAAWAAPAAGRFRVPDMRGVVPRGAGTPSGGSALAVGEYQADQMQGHKHQSPVPGTGASAASIATTPNAFFGDQATGVPIADGTNGTPRTGTETRGKARGGNWFVRRFNPSAVAYGYGIAVDDRPGVYKAGSAPGSKTGAPVAAGNLGETLATSATTVITAATGFISGNIPDTVARRTPNLTKGLYLVTGSVRLSGHAGTLGQWGSFIAVNSGAATVIGASSGSDTLTDTAAATAITEAVSIFLVTADNTTLDLKFGSALGTGTGTANITSTFGIARIG